MVEPIPPVDSRHKARILMCPPDFFGIEYEINPWMNRRVGSDSTRAAEQWRGLHRLLTDLGAEIELLEPVRGLPDLVFTANAGLVYGDLFLSSRFRHAVRQRETPYFDAWFAAHGFTVVTLPEGLYFEGAGDALFCGETLFAGYRHRSDSRSHQKVGELLGVHVLPMELVDPRFYHLDTCFCPLDPETALYHPGAFDEYGRKVITSHVPRLIEAPPEEAASFCCNAVVVGRDVVLNVGAPKVEQALRRAGFTPHATPLGEFLKSGGSAKCLTIRVDGEDAASWRTHPPQLGRTFAAARGATR
ncbi:amidinotransferase [Isosphaera pallida ATCC 43644]|jgi:N-dimethylarginine dimethylaminohydrolase|uniref:Amidinotransferase n=1 Tax=Isosphaera pallida (strain ATCC 43644 / DSM 9630 / IS1B) TaxID=575540 RepID=E8R3C8_ISOPI|nr:arginine deiminase-related protein [Isosphaera pallida]ADV63638.1 amidinotransferase [Isosphaera pallida ATCC 43644]